jgi:CBS domain containing-hemolysin-like protein
MSVLIWLILFDAALWIVTVILHSVVIPTTELSDAELERRIKLGDGEALSIQHRELVLSRLRTALRIKEVLFLVLAITLTVHIFGWVFGVIIALLLALLLDTLSRFSLIHRTTNSLYIRFEPSLIDLLKNQAWIEWFRGLTAYNPDQSAASKPDLEAIIQRSRAVITHDEFLRLSAALKLEDLVVNDVMTPVSVVDTADVHDTLGPLVMDDLHKTGHSRFPVIDGDIHHVVGTLYLHEIINLRDAKSTIKDAMDPKVHYIHESQSLEHALHGFLKTHRHLFVVVNDYRETVGVITLEDVLESLLGKKIVDEFDQFDDLRAVAESNPRKNNLPKGKTDI